MPSRPKSAPPRPPVDWAEVHARLERSTGQLTMTRRENAAREHEVLVRRARALAQPMMSSTEDAGGIDVVAFELGRQVLAVPAAGVRETVLPRDITRLPGLPAFVRGLVNVRSRVVPAFDLRPLLQLPASPDASREKLLILVFEGAEFGVLADEVTGLRRVSEKGIRSDLPGLNRSYLRGLADDGLLLLDLAALLPALTVDDGRLGT